MSQVQLNFFKVTELPDELEANSIYYVKSDIDRYATEYVTDENAEPFQVNSNLQPFNPRWAGRVTNGNQATPTVNQLYSTFTNTVTITRSSEGQYILHCADFLNDNFMINARFGINSSPQFIQAGLSVSGEISIRTFYSVDGGTYADIDSETIFEIELF